MRRDIIITTQNVQAYEMEMKELVLLMGKDVYTKWAPGFFWVWGCHFRFYVEPGKNPYGVISRFAH